MGFIFPGQRMKAKGLPRKPDYRSSLWVLPQFNGNEDSCHQDSILCSNLLGNKEGFVHFGGYHHFCQSLTARASGHIRGQRNCQVGGQGREMPKGSGMGDKKTPTQQQRTQHSVMQKDERQKHRVQSTPQQAGTLVVDLSLLVTRRPCQREPRTVQPTLPTAGAWRLPSTSARCSNQGK